MKSPSQDCAKQAISCELNVSTSFTQAIRVTRIVDTTATAQARARDGVCLYGLLHKDGCIDLLDGHHIEARGEGGDDVLENIISLCRKHHNMAEDRRITKEELYAILALYHGYTYPGIQPWTERFIKKNSEAPRLWINRIPTTK